MENLIKEVVEESSKTRRARKKLERRFEKRGEPEGEALEERLEQQKEQITKWLERHEVDRVELEDFEPVGPGDEIEAFLDQLKKRDLGL